MSVHFSSESGEWETPDALFEVLDREFHFKSDVCASRQNTMVKDNYYDKDKDALHPLHPWWPHPCWMNPPYGRQINKWVEKAFRSSVPQLAATVVCLLPARTDTGWWHDWVIKAAEIRFLKGRLKFKGAPANAPFPSAIVIFKPGVHEQKVVWWDWRTK